MMVERALRRYLTRRVLADPWPSASSLIQRNERRGEERKGREGGFGEESFATKRDKQLGSQLQGRQLLYLQNFNNDSFILQFTSENFPHRV